MPITGGGRRSSTLVTTAEQDLNLTSPPPRLCFVGNEVSHLEVGPAFRNPAVTRPLPAGGKCGDQDGPRSLAGQKVPCEFR